MDFYIFRHGLTYFAKNKLPYGDKVETAEILPEGLPALERLGEYLKEVETDINVSSTYLRCRQTAEIVSNKSGKVFEFDPLLRDWDPRNETVEDTAARITAFYSHLKSMSKNQNISVCVCTHGYPISMLRGLVLEGTINLGQLNTYPDTGTLVVIKNKSAELIDFNYPNTQTSPEV